MVMVPPVRASQILPATGKAAGGQGTDIARNLLQNTKTASGHDVARIQASLTMLAETNPALASEVRHAVNAQLSPVEQGRLASLGTGSPAAKSVDVGTISLDLTQMALDIVGIFEPTPFADGTNAIISLFRGDWAGAGLSALGIIPYVGDAAKLGKLGKWAKTISNAIEAAASNPALRKAIEPALRKVADALGKIPQSALDSLPGPARDMLTGMKGKVDDFLAAGRGMFSDAIMAVAKKTGVSPEKLQSIVDLGRGARPDPSTYLSKSYIADHLARFDEGAIRFGSRSSYNQYGTLGPSGGFVMSKREFERVMNEAQGDLRKVEEMLGLDKNYLSGSDTMIMFIDKKDFTNLKMPSGNEGGANQHWIPGGVTSGGVNEAVMDFPKGTPFKEIQLGGK